MERTLPQDYVSKVHLQRLQKEVDRLSREAEEVRVLRETQKGFNAIKEKHQQTLEELKKRLELSEEDKVKMRERLQGEIEKEKHFAISKFSKDILEIVDNLERAIQHAKEADKESNLYKGVEMTLHQALQVFARYNIHQLEDPVGKKFNPNFHEVVFESENDKVEPGTVMYVISKGYTIKERLLRPCNVGVSKKH
jgi:molecular chaperone GrpE